MEPVELHFASDDKEPIFNVIMKITFVILLLIVVGGLGYIIMTSNKKISTNKITPTSPPTKAPIEKTSPTPQYEYQGKIIELNPVLISPIPGFNNIGFSFKLEIENEGGIKTSQTIFFSKSEISTLKVKNSTNKIISYKDLKIGQIVIVNFKQIEIKILD